MPIPTAKIDRASLSAALGNDRLVILIEATIRNAMLSVVEQLGYTPANLAGDTFTGPVTGTSFSASDDLHADDDISAGGDITAGGELRGASLRIEGGPAGVSSTLSDAYIPITVDGVVMYIRLSTTP